MKVVALIVGVAWVPDEVVPWERTATVTARRPPGVSDGVKRKLESSPSRASAAAIFGVDAAGVNEPSSPGSARVRTGRLARFFLTTVLAAPPAVDESTRAAASAAPRLTTNERESAMC